MSNRTPITVARGDGIGPEIMDATLRILDEAGAALDIEEIKIGKDVYESGVPSGIPDSAWESLRRTKILLKGPITTPQGGGYKSLNVTMRKALGLYANVRPCISYAPYVETKHPNMDLVIVRENEEDLYGGIEYRQSQDVMACLKIITRPGTERIVRYAFEYARANGRRKVTCMTKDNIMKLTDGLFHKVFEEIGAEYPDIEQNHMIIDIGTAKIAAAPHLFDVIVTPNLYGDIISDVAAEITGSVGLGGSSNIGMQCSMFEAIHGSAPDIAGKGIANPSGLLLGSVMMLVHIGQGDVAAKVHNAWLRTLEDGIHTGEIFRPGLSREKVGTEGFCKAVIERLGQMPQKLRAANYDGVPAGGMKLPPLKPRKVEEKVRVGVDISLTWDDTPDALAAKVLPCVTENLELKMISNRGVKVWPNGQPDTACADNWRLRFMSKSGGNVRTSEILSLMERMNKADMNFTKSVMLHTFDGKPGFTAAQGE
ncbi:MAG: NADP-dependent isocitrate dehydrogenase [Micavibrio aeruginosavorus]|uniref:Isocitrate dehydrogenase [NADP] n=1 Tax=Micavibrio aeruginosavorus TaxID=349221 RepID=A0A7T5UG90_9BACT|nr:MAG: NADP-dependent isocitrate dehydrogenase [Micavibrio aeruginosavorus]